MEVKDNKSDYDIEICPRCGKTFQCSKSGKCWCFEYVIPAENLYLIKATYDSCLCPDCLIYYSIKQKEGLV